MIAALGRRTAARYRRSATARRLRRFRALLSPAGRAQRHHAAIPLRYRWFRLLALGQVPEPVASFAIAEPPGRPSLPYDLAVVAGGTELTPEIVDALVECERTSTLTLLIATTPEHLDAELAAVCTDLATTDPDIYEAALSKIGTERSHRLPDDPADSRAWLRALTSLR